MATYDDYLSALPRVTYRGRSSGIQRDAAARILSGTQIPPEHIASLTSIRAGEQVRPGAGAIYDHNSGGIVMPGDLHEISQQDFNEVSHHQRIIGHETGHRQAHMLNPQQFVKFLHYPVGRGLLEASAENYADVTVPHTYSGYDHLAHQGNLPFDAAAYRKARGDRYGNIYPGAL